MKRTCKYKLEIMFLYLAGRCNLACRHCWIDPAFSGHAAAPAKEIELPYVYDAIRQAKPLGLRTVKISGGEPFLRADIFELLAWLKKNGIKSSIETNGTLVGEKEARAIRNTSVVHMSVSLDGPDAKTHERLRKVEGSFEKAVAGVRALRKHNPKLSLQIICSLWKGNSDRLMEMVELSDELGATSLKINTINTMSGRPDVMAKGRELLRVQDVLKLYNSLRRRLARRKLRTSVLFDIPMAFKPLDAIAKEKSVCRVKSLVGILSDGSISMCGIGRTAAGLVVGNVRDTRLRDVWENAELFRQIREDLPGKLEGVCGKCLMKTVCIGRCRAEAYHSSEGSLFAPFSFCQEAYEQGLFPKSRLL